MPELNILYPKIVDLEKCPEICSVKQVIVTEKIHGKNMRVIIPPRCSDPSQIVIGGREVTEQDPSYGLGSETLFLRETLPLSSIVEHFKGENITYVIYGEICGLGVQKGMKYSDKKEFRVFDISMAEYLLDFSEVVRICKELELKIVPVLYEGEPGVDIFNRFINVPSAFARENGIATTIAEGIVIKTVPVLKNKFGDYIICKHKSHGFEEKISKPKEEKPKLDSSPLAEFATKYVVETRVKKMIDKLKEKGAFTGSMADAKALGDELAKDIATEEKKELEEILARNPQFNEKLLFAEIMKVAVPILKSELEDGT